MSTNSTSDHSSMLHANDHRNVLYLLLVHERDRICSIAVRFIHKDFANDVPYLANEAILIL